MGLWVERVLLEPEDHAAATATANLTWTTAQYGDETYASVVRAVCFAVFLGVTLALVLSRWLFSAVTRYSFFCSARVDARRGRRLCANDHRLWDRPRRRSDAGAVQGAAARARRVPTRCESQSYESS